MEEQYREMFDEVRASSRLREEVAHMTTRERKPSRRRLPKAAVAAAAVLVLLAGTALAAVGAPGTIRDWFAREWEEITGDTMDAEQLDLIDRLTKPVGVSDTQNGTTVTVDSVTVGNSTVWMLVKVSGDYTQEKESLYHFQGMDLTLDPDPDLVDTPGGYSLDYPYVGVAEDGTLTMLVRFTIDLAGQSSLLDGVRQATLLVDNLMYSDQTMTEGHWTLTFPWRRSRHPPWIWRPGRPGPFSCGTWRSPQRTSRMSSLWRTRSGTLCAVPWCCRTARWWNRAAAPAASGMKPVRSGAASITGRYR